MVIVLSNRDCLVQHWLYSRSSINMKVKKVNWYDEELHKFYDTKKDNDGFIYGLYGYDGDNIIDVQWFKSEIERDQQASKQKG